jgi:mono/diheme cytochrome c family protein
MYKAIFYTHLISVNIFLLIYIVKTVLLLTDKKQKLAQFTKAIKVPEMMVSTLFLVTGIYMLMQIPEIKTLLVIKIIVVFASIPIAIIGFKKGNKVLAVLSLLFIISAYGMAEMSKKQKTATVESTSSTSVNGQQIYTAHCARCHGDDGKLGMSGASDLSVCELNLQEKIDIIKTGKGGIMPSYITLGDEQIKVVAIYIESLKK